MFKKLKLTYIHIHIPYINCDRSISGFEKSHEWNYITKKKDAQTTFILKFIYFFLVISTSNVGPELTTPRSGITLFRLSQTGTLKILIYITTIFYSRAIMSQQNHLPLVLNIQIFFCHYRLKKLTLI